MTEERACDFCGIHEIEWYFPCQPFSIGHYVPGEGLTITNMDGIWLACKDCGRLIIEKDYKGLLDRSVDSPDVESIHMSRVDKTLITIGLHAKFFSNRRGEPERIGASEE